MSSIPAITSQWHPTSFFEEPNRDEWKDTFSFIDATTVGCGGSGTVFLIDEKRVLKIFSQDFEGERDLSREAAIYRILQRGGYSEYIVRFYEVWESGLVLERHVKTLRQTLATARAGSPSTLALQWAKECCRGVNYLHQCGVWHGDLGCQNILVDQKNHLKVCDFAGSKFHDGEDWKDAWISYEVRSQHPDYRGKQPTIESEIFALGSILFEIWTSRPPFASESSALVRQKFENNDFPLLMVKDPKMQGIIKRCWTGRYTNVAEICYDLEKRGD